MPNTEPYIEHSILRVSGRAGATRLEHGEREKREGRR
jgi:hypothetical protein